MAPALTSFELYGDAVANTCRVDDTRQIDPQGSVLLQCVFDFINGRQFGSRFEELHGSQLGRSQNPGLNNFGYQKPVAFKLFDAQRLQVCSAMATLSMRSVS